MPEICRFHGIIIVMYHNDHPPAHFHARHAGHDIQVYIDSGLVEGSFPSSHLRYVLDWYALHRDELRANWSLARDRKPLNGIDPLE